MTSPVPRFSRRAVILGGVATAVVGGVAACAGGSKRQAAGRAVTPSPGPTSAGPASGGLTTTSDTSPPTPTGPATFVTRGPSTAGQVALTFHISGDDSIIDAMLSTLAQHRTPVTAFVVGTWLDANHSYARRIQQGGHELANHTWSHPTFASLGAEGMTAEITRCRNLLQDLTGTGGRWFRPSGTDNGVDSPSAAVLDAAGQAGYRTVVGYDVDPADYQDPGASAVVSRTLQAVRPGSIVSLHFGHQGTVDAMGDLLAGLDRARLRPVTLATLLSRP